MTQTFSVALPGTVSCLCGAWQWIQQMPELGISLRVAYTIPSIRWTFDLGWRELSLGLWVGRQ